MIPTTLIFCCQIVEIAICVGLAGFTFGFCVFSATVLFEAPARISCWRTQLRPTRRNKDFLTYQGGK